MVQIMVHVHAPSSTVLLHRRVAIAPAWPGAPGHRPFGCQTVLVSVNARMRDGPFGGAIQSGSTAGSVDGASPAGRTTRVSVAAAAASSAPQSNDGSWPGRGAAPARSIARTASCEASHGATSAVEPVSTLTTPPGTSDVASTSLNVTAGHG